jgi:hypothetical protein
MQVHGVAVVAALDGVVAVVVLHDENDVVRSNPLDDTEEEPIM